MKIFGNYHPLVLLTYFLSVLAVAMFVTNPILQTLALLGGCLFSLMLLKRKEILSNLGFYSALFIMIALTNPLFSHNGVTPLFFLNGNPVTLEAIIYGIFIGVMIIAVMLWCRCYSEIMTSDKFIYLFGKAIPKLSLVLSMALRFIPLFKRQVKKVSQTQKAMGLYSSKSYSDRLKGTIRVFNAMIAWSLENSIETSASMKARGYGIKGRTNFSIFRFHSKDLILIISIFLLFGITLTGTAFKITEFYYYPEITALNTSPFAIIIYSAFSILSFLPFLIELGGNLTWKYYISKI